MATASLAGRRARMLASAVALTLVAVTVPALARPEGSAAQAAQDPAGKVVIWENANGKVLAAAPGVTDKRSLVLGRPAPVTAERRTRALAEAGVSAEAETPYPDRIEWLYPRGSISGDPTGSAPSTLGASGGANVSLPYLEYWATWTQISSRVSWFGSAPMTADRVTHTDQWHVDFVGTGYQAWGTPPGAVTTSGPSSADVKWTTSVDGNWYSEHQWNYLAFYPEDPPLFGQIYRLQHSVTGVFQFGSTFYTVTGDAKSFT